MAERSGLLTRRVILHRGFESHPASNLWWFLLLSTNKNFIGLACTKAGVSPLQGESGGFDSLRVHKNFDVKVISGLIQRYNLYKSCGRGAIG